MAEKKRLLLISYYWPPAGGIGVQRWLTMTYYLAELGWDITVVKPLNADYPIVDLNNITKIHPSIKFVEIENWEVRKLYARFFSGNNKNVKADDIFFLKKDELTRKQKVSLWIRSNLFVPDARVTWVRPVTKFLKNHLQTHPFDVLITTGPPHSAHLIGANIKSVFPHLKWVADFRDPWTDIEYHQNLLLTSYADKLHQHLERKVLVESDLVVTVSQSWADRFRELGAQNVEVVINGYDEKDFEKKLKNPSKKFCILHAGSFGENRWIPSFWKAIEELLQDEMELKADLQIRFIGQIENAVQTRMEQHVVKENIQLLGQLPHNEAIQEMLDASLLFLPINKVQGNNKGRMTGKIYEYIATGNPILLIGNDDGDAFRLIKEEGLGYSCGYDETKKIKESILSEYIYWKSGGMKEKAENNQRYSRREAARKMSELMRS